MKEYVRWYHDTDIPKTGRLTDFVGLQDGESKIKIIPVLVENTTRYTIISNKKHVCTGNKKVYTEANTYYSIYQYVDMALYYAGSQPLRVFVFEDEKSLNEWFYGEHQEEEKK